MPKKRLSVCILAEGVGRALRLYSDTTEHDRRIYILVCNSQARGLFTLRQIKSLARAGPREWIMGARLLCQGKIRVSSDTPYAEKNIRWLRKVDADIGLHAMGVIYRKELIECFHLGILNSHIGILPEYRGRSVFEWTLLMSDMPGVTTFFVDEGIDTGEPIVWREVIKPKGGTLDEAKRFLFSLDGVMYSRALERIEKVGTKGCARNIITKGRRYYVMSRLLTGVVEKIFRYRYNA